MKLRNIIFIAILTLGLTSSTTNAAEIRWPMQLRNAVILATVFIPIVALVVAPYPKPTLPAGDYSQAGDNTQTFGDCHIEDGGRLHCTAYGVAHDVDVVHEWHTTLDNADNCAWVTLEPGDSGLKWTWYGKNPSLTCAKYKTPPEYRCKEYR